MPTPDIEAPIPHHKVRVDAANNVCTHFVTAGEGRRTRSCSTAPRGPGTTFATSSRRRSTLAAGSRSPTTAAPMPEKAPLHSANGRFVGVGPVGYQSYRRVKRSLPQGLPTVDVGCVGEAS